MPIISRVMRIVQVSSHFHFARQSLNDCDVTLSGSHFG
jgi:urease beta subunit